MKSQHWMLGLAMACMSLVAGPGGATQAIAAGADHAAGSSFRVAQYNYNQGMRRDSRHNRWRRGSRGRDTYRDLTVPQGTDVAVSVNSAISTENANVGDRWVGAVQRDVVVDGRVAIPAGTPVSGTVTESQPGRRGSQAVLGLALTSIDRDGQSYPVHGSTDPLVAGSARARNLGLIVGGAAAGAVVGHAVGHSGKGTLIGGLLGGLLGGAVARNHPTHMELRPPTTIDFTVDEPVALRY